MKLSELENRFKDFVLKSESTSYLSEEEKEMKNRIWSKVTTTRKPRRKKNMLYPALAAAASIMFLTVTLFSFKIVIHKNEMIGQLEVELEVLEQERELLKMQFSEVSKEFQVLESQPPVIDTVTVYKTKIIYKTPAFTNEDYITDLNSIQPFEDMPDVIVLGEDKMDFRNAREDIKDFKIEYGRPTEDGTVPWTFAVNYK